MRQERAGSKRAKEVDYQSENDDQQAKRLQEMNLNENLSNVLYSLQRRQDEDNCSKSRIDFIVDTQEVDESPLPNERPPNWSRLAKLKAQAVKTRHPKQLSWRRHRRHPGSDLRQAAFHAGGDGFLRRFSAHSPALTGVAIISADNVLKTGSPQRPQRSGNWTTTPSGGISSTPPLDAAGAYGSRITAN